MTPLAPLRFALPAVLALWWCAAAADRPPGPARFSWKSVMGTHYRLDVENWLGATRGWPDDIGFLPDVTAIPHDGIPGVTGHFSREQRFYDFRGVVPRPPRAAPTAPQARRGLDSDARDALERRRQERAPAVRRRAQELDQAVRQAMAARVDLVWHTGQVSPARRDQLEYLMAKKGAYFKDALYETYRHFHSGEFQNKPITIYWEIGNEVNSSQRFSIRDLTGANMRWAIRNTPGIMWSTTWRPPWKRCAPPRATRTVIQAGSPFSWARSQAS